MDARRGVDDVDRSQGCTARDGMTARTPAAEAGSNHGLWVDKEWSGPIAISPFLRCLLHQDSTEHSPICHGYRLLRSHFHRRQARLDAPRGYPRQTPGISLFEPHCCLLHTFLCSVCPHQDLPLLHLPLLPESPPEASRTKGASTLSSLCPLTTVYPSFPSSISVPTVKLL
ncbi:hypothetical protein VUR80DRAFT_5161 [Thermomyces stellatus]